MEALAGKLPIAPVLTLKEALDSPYAARVGMIQDLAHPAAADFRVLANPIKLDGQRMAGRGCAALGADNTRLLGAG